MQRHRKTIIRIVAVVMAGLMLLGVMGSMLRIF